MKEKVQMTIKEADRLGLMRQVDQGKLSLKRVSEELGLSLRQVKRIRKRYIAQGEKGLVSLKRGRESNRKIPQNTRNKILSLLREEYPDFGPTLACEKLLERNEIRLSTETIRKWQIQEGLWKPKNRKECRVYQRRARRDRFGELLQGDGSPHDWFEGRGAKCSLLQFVDDATGRTTVAKFVPSETTDGYLDLLGEHLERYGRPLALYVDKHAVFRVNREEMKKGIAITHFGRVLKDLDIELICANSPQAKGRVERKNGVFQDRLTKEMRLRGINSMEEGNVFLKTFLKEINEKFGKPAASQEDAHRPLRRQDDLNRIFARRDIRKLSKDLTFQHRGVIYMIQTDTPNRLKHATVEIRWAKNEPITVEYHNKVLSYKKWAETTYEQPSILDSKEIAMATWVNRKAHKPKKHHPWKSGIWKKTIGSET